MTQVPIWLEVAINDLGLTEADFRRFFKARRVRTVKPIYVKTTSPHVAMGDDNICLAKASRPGSQSWKAQSAESLKEVVDEYVYNLNFCDED